MEQVPVCQQTSIDTLGKRGTPHYCWTCVRVFTINVAYTDNTQGMGECNLLTCGQRWKPRISTRPHVEVTQLRIEVFHYCWIGCKSRLSRKSSLTPWGEVINAYRGESPNSLLSLLWYLGCLMRVEVRLPTGPLLAWVGVKPPFFICYDRLE